MADERKTFNKKKKLPAQLSSVGKESESLKKDNYKRAGQSEGKDYSLEDKLPKLKEKRRKKMYRRLVSLLFLFSFAILIVVYFITPLSKVDQVSVSGTKEVTDQAIIDASQIRSGDSLWETFFSRNKIETTVKKQLPQVKSMKLKFNSINSYELVVSEYKTVASLEKGDEYYNIL